MQLTWTRQAQNEALLALDFISLLLSKDAPIQGQQTMSQLLTQLVPSGTLAYDKWPINEPSSEDKQIEKAVTQGWQMSSVEDSANSLSKAGNRLQKGVEQEQIYWDELLAISDRGYAVARVNPNRNRHIFGAQVGFMDGEFPQPTLSSYYFFVLDHPMTYYQLAPISSSEASLPYTEMRMVISILIKT